MKVDFSWFRHELRDVQLVGSGSFKQLSRVSGRWHKVFT